ncbi:hypothetical protein ACFWZJ_29195 [Streptomyces massasporeus]
MQLAWSRRRLGLAYKYLNLLEDAVDTREGFLDVLVGGIAVIRSVGQVVHTEAPKGFQDFDQWWKQTRHDSRLVCVKDLRDLVLKEREEGATHVRHEVSAGTAEVTVTAYDPTVVISGDGAVTGDAGMVTETVHIKLVRDSATVERRALTTTAPRAAAPGPAHRSTWVFSGGECDGEALLPALRRYLDWMRDEIIPKAERLLTGTG